MPLIAKFNRLHASLSWSNSVSSVDRGANPTALTRATYRPDFRLAIIESRQFKDALRRFFCKVFWMETYRKNARTVS